MQKDGYEIKVQKVERPTNRSYYVNLPVALAEALGIKKGESFLWHVEDKNTLVFRRAKPVAAKKLKSLG
ncbi:MAG: AbrB/MazE/SpoVT family DNA-binding domain-containing protein [Puniceicoccaceae bacterium]|nr:MAG: AbrB/MazE/SpoVT family DNA-binding domain-containing protein [Puniceicoccaceae bacterium]